MRTESTHSELVQNIQERARERTARLADAKVAAIARESEYLRSRPEPTSPAEWMRLMAERPSVARRRLDPLPPLPLPWPPFAPPDPNCVATLAAPYVSGSPTPPDDGSLPLRYAAGDAVQGRIELVAAAFGHEDENVVNTVPGFSYLAGMNVQRASGALLIHGTAPAGTTASVNVFVPVRVRGNILLLKGEKYNRLDLAAAWMIVSATVSTTSHHGDKFDSVEPVAQIYAPVDQLLSLGSPVDFFGGISIDVPAHAGDAVHVAVDATLTVAVNSGSDLLVAGGFSRSGIYSTGVGDAHDGIEIAAIQLTSC